jgi:hypothetical protein
MPEIAYSSPERTYTDSAGVRSSLKATMASKCSLFSMVTELDPERSEPLLFKGSLDLAQIPSQAAARETRQDGGRCA